MLYSIFYVPLEIIKHCLQTAMYLQVSDVDSCTMIYIVPFFCLTIVPFTEQYTIVLCTMDVLCTVIPITIDKTAQKGRARR